VVIFVAHKPTQQQSTSTDYHLIVNYSGWH